MFLADAAIPHCNLWCDYVHTQFDPAHLLSEMGFTVVFDLILVWLIWGKILKPRLVKQIHQDLDEEHGVTHHDDHVHVDDINEWTDDELIHGLNSGILKFGDPTPEQQRTFIEVMDKVKTDSHVVVPSGYNGGFYDRDPIASIERFQKAEDAATRRAQVPGDLGPL